MSLLGSLSRMWQGTEGYWIIGGEYSALCVPGTKIQSGKQDTALSCCPQWGQHSQGMFHKLRPWATCTAVVWPSDSPPQQNQPSTKQKYENNLCKGNWPSLILLRKYRSVRPTKLFLFRCRRRIVLRLLICSPVVIVRLWRCYTTWPGDCPAIITAGLQE